MNKPHISYSVINKLWFCHIYMSPTFMSGRSPADICKKILDREAQASARSIVGGFGLRRLLTGFTKEEQEGQ